MPNKILTVATHLGFPIIFMSISGWYGIRTFFHLLFNFQFRTIFSISAFKKVWFANFWSVYGAGLGEDRVRPLAEKAYGVVLDIGPGAGHWLALFDKSKVTKIYGVEPNADHYELLQKRIKAAGMVDIYEIIPSSVEDIHKYGIAKESFDSVVTIQCLCSIPKPQEMIANVYKYIKPGGQWIVCEHVITPQTGWISWYQAGLDIFWPHFFGGCRITRDTGRCLREAGEWSSVDLKLPDDDESYYHVLPHAVGVLVKLASKSQPMMVPWNRAQSTEMHPDAPPSARSLANNQDDDDTDEWEYEYSTTETESYYVTLDLTTSTAPAQRRARQKRRGVDTKNPENNGPKWKSAGMGLSKRHLEPAPKIGISLEDNGEVEAENENDNDDDEQNEGDLDANDEKDALITADSGEIKNPSQVQIIGLDTEDPIISYGGNVFSCRWEQNIGTELLFTEYDPKNPSPALRSLPGGVDLLGISSARIVSEAARLDPIDHEKTDDVYRETRGRGRRGRGSRGKIRGRGTRRAARFYIPIGKYANRKRKEQGQFLEAMTGIKAAKGEDDAVTVIAIARKANKVWRHHVEGERAVERKKLERAVVKTGRRAEEARARLAEMDRQDEVATVIRGSMAIRRPSKRAGRQKKVGRRRKKSPEPEDSPFTRQRQLSYNLDGSPFEGNGEYMSTSTPRRWSDLEDDMDMTGMASIENDGGFYESNILDQNDYEQNNYGDSSMAYGDYGDDGLYDEDAPGEDDDTQMPYEWQY